MNAIDDLLSRAKRLAQSLRRFPVSTYRLQLHAHFTFTDAAALVPYLSDLGITHVYCSPYMRARPGSMHGYDVIDHNQLNPELGTSRDLDHFCEVLGSYHMSHILDTVPNHAGVATNLNNWWNDVLENGPDSTFGHYFDINWRGSPRQDLQNRVLLPVLGDPYQQVLEKGQLRLERNEPQGKYFISYFDRRFPVSAASYPLIAIIGKTPDSVAMNNLLNHQFYRLAYWRDASEQINYRRFFDISDLAALAMEHSEVFDAAHALTLQLAAQGCITGLRIDHPDGLYDPRQYFTRLQHGFLLACARRLVADESAWKTARPELVQRLAVEPEGRALYVVAEKILATDEQLPDWACHGTTGYDFLNVVNGLFISTSNERAFTDIYEQLTGDATSFNDLAVSKKKRVLLVSFASELQMLTMQLQSLVKATPLGNNLSYDALKTALCELIACFPVYRTYITAQGVSAVDFAYVTKAVQNAIRRNPTTPAATLQLIADLQIKIAQPPQDEVARLRFVGKFQQLCSPVMAKGVEDTAFYIYHRFISLNEVGGDPSRFGVSPEAVHQYFSDRQKRWPHALSALSTHDTKRSEDVRSRLNVLSELPTEWHANVTRWMVLNAPHRTYIDGAAIPAPDEEYLIYQTLIGAWPLDTESADEIANFVKRVQEYMVKALREAKLRSNWSDPNEPYEKAVTLFIDRIINPSFLDTFIPFCRRVSREGLTNSLAQTVLRLAAPGVPDTYQGMELLDFSLVDPDNRRPVDYELRKRLLHESSSGSTSAPKMWVTRQLLHLRRIEPELFASGSYEPIHAGGTHRQHVFAFARRYSQRCAIIVVPRLTTSMTGDWVDTSLPLPPSINPWLHLFTAKQIANSAEVRLSELFSDFPVAVLTARN